ncbi:hypothetical protein CCR75_001378 [Bremia lactucae]|uniref:C2 domain-containing protein n=1 Tax=Bremia lactucae TaxID=4779 RepID=A0A976IAD9_BRELC|nr:hypothetical protein CCR75_001378 [Bremia lactucae]
MELHVRACSARNLLIKQTFGKQDPFCTIKLRGKSFKTRVHDNGHKTPVWNEVFVLSVVDPQLDELFIEVKDKNFTSSTLIGDCRLPVSMFTNSNGSVVDQWYPLKNGSKSAGEINLRVQLRGPGMQAARAAIASTTNALQQSAYPYPQQTSYTDVQQYPAASAYPGPNPYPASGAYPAPNAYPTPSAYPASNAYPAASMPSKSGAVASNASAPAHPQQSYYQQPPQQYSQPMPPPYYAQPPPPQYAQQPDYYPPPPQQPAYGYPPPVPVAYATGPPGMNAYSAASYGQSHHGSSQGHGGGGLSSKFGGGGLSSKFGGGGHSGKFGGGSSRSGGMSGGQMAMGIGAGVLGGMLLGEALDDVFD